MTSNGDDLFEMYLDNLVKTLEDCYHNGISIHSVHQEAYHAINILRNEVQKKDERISLLEEEVENLREYYQ